MIICATTACPLPCVSSCELLAPFRSWGGGCPSEDVEGGRKPTQRMGQAAPAQDLLPPEAKEEMVSFCPAFPFQKPNQYSVLATRHWSAAGRAACGGSWPFSTGCCCPHAHPCSHLGWWVGRRLFPMRKGKLRGSGWQKVPKKPLEGQWRGPPCPDEEFADPKLEDPVAGPALQWAGCCFQLL